METVDGIECLSDLKWLSLMSNYLTSLPSLHTLNQLTHLNISDNSVSSLTNLKVHFISNSSMHVLISCPLQSLSLLVELYASCNKVTDTRQLFSLKPLLNLVTVDLSFNPLSTAANYRAFALYHLSFIRALDGQPVVSISDSLYVSVFMIASPCFTVGGE